MNSEENMQTFTVVALFFVPWKGILTGKTHRQTRKWLDEKKEEKNALESCDSPVFAQPITFGFAYMNSDWLISL